MLNRALPNHDTHPLSTHVAARAHLWVGWAFQRFAFCIPLLCFSSCTPGYPQWDVPQTMLLSLQSWHNPPKGQGCTTFWEKQVQLFSRKSITQVQTHTNNEQTHSQMYLLSKHVYTHIHLCSNECFAEVFEVFVNWMSGNRYALIYFPESKVADWQTRTPSLRVF